MGAPARLVRRGRRAAERLMVDACEIREPSAYGPVDPETGQREVIPGELLYGPDVEPLHGRCKIQNQRLRYPSEPDSAQHVWTVGPSEIHIPVSAPDKIRDDCVVTIVDSFDPRNVGRRMRVRIGDRKSLQTAIRLLVEEVVG